jgi:hypothetical protein
MSMIGFGALQFLSPLALIGLLALPLLWWLLRLTPPAPHKLDFPALFLLRGLAPQEQTSAHTPWWLLLLRLGLLILLLLGLAHPVWRDDTKLVGSGELTLLIDNGWTSVSAWPKMIAVADALCQRAAQDGRVLRVIPTAPEAPDGKITPLPKAPALTQCTNLTQLQPQPWPADHQAVLKILEELQLAETVFWLNDGFTERNQAQSLLRWLQTNASLTLYQQREPLLWLQRPASPTSETGKLQLSVQRLGESGARTLMLLAQDINGATLGTGFGEFKGNERTTEISIKLDATLRAQTAQVILPEARGAGGVWLLDDLGKRQQIGLLGDELNRKNQPLLNGLHYLQQALGPEQSVAIGTLDALLEKQASVIFNTAEAPLLPDAAQKLEQWVEQGGVLVQFAGGNLDRRSPLLPVALRQDQRDLGGSLSWAQPQGLADFPAASAFSALERTDEITVAQQILAEPSSLTGDNVWVSLKDGTPLVTSKSIGSGRSILFHVPATPIWSNLPLSGLFPAMLDRLVELGGGGGSVSPPDTTLTAQAWLDGFGVLRPATQSVTLTTQQQRDFTASALTPAGLYGSEGKRRAFNLGTPALQPQLFTASEAQALPRAERNLDLQPWLLLAALVLFLLDLIVALALRGLWPKLPARSAVMLLMLGFISPNFVQAEPVTVDDTIRLGYVINGAAEATEIAAQGLGAVAVRVREKTAVDKIDSLPVDLAKDDLSLFSFLYWPMLAPPNLDVTAQARLQTYLAQGGMMLIDLRSEPEDNLILREAGIPLPALSPVTAEHPLYRTFYLLQDCPGRIATGTFWSERDLTTRQDNVPALFIGARDWASAWANGSGQQSETALRCGLNLVLYALTGNYKTDQIHVATILERLRR